MNQPSLKGKFYASMGSPLWKGRGGELIYWQAEKVVMVKFDDVIHATVWYPIPFEWSKNQFLLRFLTSQ